MDTELTDIKGVGSTTAGLLARLNIRTVADLIDHYPRRYEDYSRVQNIADIEPGLITVKATIKVSGGHYGKSRGTHITRATADDGTGTLQVVWFNQPYRAAGLRHGQEYYLSGGYDYSGKYLSLTNPSIELVSTFTVNTARVLPVYPETKGLTSVRIRKIMVAIEPYFSEVTEVLPESVLAGEFLSLTDALRKLHFPKTSEDIELAKKNLGFRELFELSLASQLLKKDIEKYRSPVVPIDEKKLVAFADKLPFRLTDTQRSVAWQILQDMAAGKHPMNRMVEGDVGSGKTVIAAMAALNVIVNGGQVALMAPTELLAAQHQSSFKELFDGFLAPEEIAFVSGSQTKVVRAEALERIGNGTAKLAIGTHALFQKSLIGSAIQLLIIDEQHRFGVSQREKLLGKAELVPHVLTLTATPIPRTLALVLYGELSVSILHEKPPGRKEVTTELVSLASRFDVLKGIFENAGPTRQVYLVCPAIESSDMSDSIEDIAVMLDKKFPSIKYEVLTGRMKQPQKDAAMERFSSGQVHILLATTVIEVGVNVVTASTMAIFSPERFGLAQLHQLRGRVGRGNDPGDCRLFLGSNNKPSRRLEMVSRINDGFKLADIDLELRGPGAIYGSRQSGALDLRMASLSDTVLVKKAHTAAASFVATDQNLLEYKQLHTRIIGLQKVTNLN